MNLNLPAHFVECPEFDCTAAASVVPWSVLWATNGAVPISKVVCVRGHVYHMPTDHFPVEVEAGEPEADCAPFEILSEEQLQDRVTDLTDVDREIRDLIGEWDA